MKASAPQNAFVEIWASNIKTLSHSISWNENATFGVVGVAGHKLCRMRVVDSCSQAQNST
jgi:hypothetical protein